MPVAPSATSRRQWRRIACRLREAFAPTHGAAARGRATSATGSASPARSRRAAHGRRRSRWHQRKAAPASARMAAGRASVRHRGRGFGAHRHRVGQRRQRRLDARICASLTRLAEHLLEARLHHARDDVLPAIGLQHRRARPARRALAVEAMPATLQEVVGVGRGLRLQDAVDAADQLDQVVDRGVALPRPTSAWRPRAPTPARRGSRAATPPSSGTGTRPCTASDRPSSRVDARAVVGLREQLDVAGQREHRPGATCRARTRRRRWAAAGSGSPRHAVGDQPLDAAEQLLVLELLVGEAHQRLERGLVAEPVVAAHLEHLGADEALDQAEHVGVGAALHLAQEAPLVGVRKLELVDERQPVGQELLARSRSCGRGSRRGRCPSGCAWRLRCILA